MFTKLMVVSLLVFLSSTSFVRENIIFQKVNEITTTHSRWLITFVIDLTPYNTLLNKLDSQISDVKLHLSKEVLKYWEKRKLDRYAKFENVFMKIKNEIWNLNLTKEVMWSDLTDIRTLLGKNVTLSRNRRALIPIVGKALSFLFGTVSESDIKAIRNNVLTLAENQKKITHVLNESLSIITISQSHISQNRKKINQLIVNIGELKNISRILSSEIGDLDYFFRVYAQFDRTLSSVHELMYLTSDYLQSLKLQLNMLSLGHLSPAVISPSNFRKLLLDVKSKLPPKFKFSLDPRTNLWKLYQTLTCATLMESNKLLVVISIPLLDVFGKFELFKIHNIAVMQNFSGEVNMFAQYQLETHSLAVNRKRTQYVILSPQETTLCSDITKMYCKIQSPVYSMTSSKLCVIKVFLNLSVDIKTYCKIIIRPNIVLPKAEYLTDGQWAVATRKVLHFRIICQDDLKTGYNDTLIINPPVMIVTLKMSCSAYNGYITLLPYFHRESAYSLDTSLKIFLKNYQSTQLKLWGPIHTSFPDLGMVKIPKTLNEYKEIPINSLIKELSSIDTQMEPMPDISIWSYVLTSVLILVIIIFVIVCCRKRIKDCFKIFPNFQITKKRVAKSGNGGIEQSKPLTQAGQQHLREHSVSDTRRTYKTDKPNDDINVYDAEVKTIPVITEDTTFRFKDLYPKIDSRD